MDVHMNLRNSQTANAHMSQPPAFLNPHGTHYLSAADDYHHRFLADLGAPGLTFRSAIASDRGLQLPWENGMHDLGSSMGNPPLIGLADAAHFAVTPIQGSWTRESFPSRSDILLSADASRDYLSRYNASVLSSMHANPVIPNGMADLNAQLQSFSGSEILHKTEFDPMTGLGYPWTQMLGASQVDPAAVILRQELAAHAEGSGLGNTLSFDKYIPTTGRNVVPQEQINPLLSIPSFFGTGQTLESKSALLRVPAGINETSLDAQSYLYNSSDPLLEVRRMSCASMGGLAFMPQEMHIIAPPVQNVKKRKFLHEWEKEDSWSRDEYDDADDLDTGTTDAGKSQVESPHKLCIQAADQTRSDEKSNRALVTWTDVDVPEGSKISKETGATVQRIRGTSQQHSAKSDHSRVKSKHKHHKNAGVPKESCTAAISSEEMMLWPPAVVVYNTRTGKTAEGVWDGMSGKEMDTYLKGIGHSQGKSRPVWGKQGHKGLVLVKYKPNLQGLQEAERLHKHFEVNRRGCQQWLHINAKSSGNDSELRDGPDFVHVDAATNESKRILYGFLAGPSDVENLDPGSKIKFTVQSKSEILERQHLLEKVID